MGISLYNAALCLHGNSGNTACDYKRIPIEISKGGSIFYHITFLRNRDSSFVDGKEEWKILAWGVSIGSVLLLYLLRGETLRESLLCIKRSVLETAEEYFQIYLGSYFNVDASVDSGMVVLGILIGMLLSYGIVCMKHSWMPVILLGVGILIPFTVGKVPKMAEVVLCMLSVGGIVAAKTERGFQVQRQSGFAGVILVAAALAVGSMFSGMQVQKAFGDRKDVTKQISELLKEKFIGFFWKSKGRSE